jgi:serum/glucocorticoid-regulated kinase 2
VSRLHLPSKYTNPNSY